MKIKQDESMPGSSAMPAGGASPPTQPERGTKRWQALQRWFVRNTFTARFLVSPWHRPAAGYLAALITQSSALMLVVLLSRIFPSFHFPFILFVLSPLLIALGWGVLPSIAATVIGGIMLAFFLIPPYFSLLVASFGDLLGLVIYFSVGVTIGILASRVQREREQAELLAARLDSILQAIPDPVLFYNTQGRPTQLNRASQEKYALSLQDGMSTDLLSQLDIRSAEGKLLTVDTTPLARALRGESVIGEEIYYCTVPDRSDRVVSVSVAPVRSADGHTIEGAVAVSHDLTALRASEERYRMIVQTTNEGIWLIDLHGQTIYANERMAVLLGVSSAELVERSLLSFVFPEDQALAQQHMANNLQGHHGQAEFRFRRSNGDSLYTMAATSPMRSGSGSIIGVLGLYTDITRNKQAEQDLEFSEERLRVALRNSLITVYQQDRDLRYTRMYNPLSAFNPEMILGKFDADFVQPEEAEYLTQLKRRVLTTGKGIREVISTTSDAGLRSSELTIEPLRDMSGTIVGVTGTALDLTERIRTEEERMRLLARAQSSEYRFQRLFDANLIGLIIADTERVFEANDAFLHLLGYSRADLEAGLVNWRTMTPPEYASLDKQAINDLAMHGESAPFEKAYIHKNGSRVPVLIGATAIEQEPLVWLCFVLDLSERNRLEREARAQANELEALFEAITDGIMVYDAAGSIVRLNSNARMQVSRYLSSETFSHSVYSRAAMAIPRAPDGSTMSLPQIPIMRVLKGETISGADAVDVRVKTFDGEDLWLNMSGTPLRDEQGNLTGAISIGRDVTERRKLEQRTRTALEALLEMAQVLVQGAEDMPEVTANTHVDSVYSRQVVQRLAELTTRVLGCQRLGFMRVEPETELLHPLAVVGLSPEQEEQWWREQEGQEVHLSGPGSDPVMVARLRANEVLLIDLTQPPYDQAPNPYGILQMLVVPMMLDNRLLGFLTLDYGGLEHTYTPEEMALTKAVTRLAALAMERDRLLLEAAQSRANELAALAANQLKDEFIGVAGHELRTPLTSMKINVQLATRQLRRQLTHYNNKLEKVATNAGEDDDTEETAGRSSAVNVYAEIVEVLESQLVFLARMRRQLDMQNRLVQDLLDVSRLERGQLELRLTEFDLSALLREAVTEQQDISSNRTIQLSFPQPVAEVYVTADRDRISQVISNYLSNALKYSDADKPVSLSVKQGDQQVCVTVRDQGPGLSIHEQQHVWERFYRSPGVEVRSGSGIGLGLGLSISRTIIEQHNGRVGVESQEGEGATFWFTLPLQGSL